LGIKDKLAKWMLHYKVSHNCGNSLLELLRSEGMEVPKDIRTLMKTPKHHEIMYVSNGSYIHFGLENMLLPILKLHNANIHLNDNILKIGINIDGLPISKSSKSQLWPVLISILNFREIGNKVIPVGIFHRYQKPESLEQYLNPFIDDILEVIEDGLNVNGSLIKLEISNIMCDSPAKAFILGVKSHNAYFGCTSCIEEGSYLKILLILIFNFFNKNLIVFPGIDSPLRTDESFRNKSNEEFHKYDSPLLRLPINIIDTVCLDYIHNVCLGVMKRLILHWVRGNKQVILPDEKINKINCELNVLRSYVPSEICRLQRAINDIEYWKATELRTFLFYSGPIILKGKIFKAFYNHFLLLVYGF